MLQFETLLLKQLQRQQSRAEFCDAVLQTQGLSVPVHSCVLSAFSPRLCGVLASMPAPTAGHRRLIRLQAVEACTLLSLVSMLYSGQLHDNREEVLSAAESLGIELPQQHVPHLQTPQGEMVRGRREQDKWMSGGDGEKLRESGSQTEDRSETKERETQTDHTCLDSQQSSVSVSLTGQSVCSINDSDVTLMPLRVHNPPEKRPYTCYVLSEAPAAEVINTVSDPARYAQIYLYPPKASYLQVPVTATPQPPPSHNTCLELGAIQSEGSSVSATRDCNVNGYEQFDGNIPGFISHFLDPVNSQDVGRRHVRPRMRGGVGAEESMRRARVRSRGGRTVGEGFGRGRRRHGLVERLGWVVGLVCRGQGGGRVGRKLDTRPTKKAPVRLFARNLGTWAVKEVGERRRSGRTRQRGRRGTHESSERQDEPPRVKRPRGRPRLRSLPSSSVSSTSCGMIQVNQNSTASPLPSLLHTEPLPPVPDPTQPMDWLLDDILTGFHLLPPVPAEDQTQHDFVNTAIPSVSNTTYPNKHSTVKPVDPKVSQQQPEGELNDILDNFLKTFEQQVDGLDLEEDQSQHYTAIKSWDGARISGGCHKSGSSTDPWGNTPNTCTQLQLLQPQSVHHHPPKPDFCPHGTHASNASTTCCQLQSQLNNAKNALQIPSILGLHKPSYQRKRSKRQPGKVPEGLNLESRFETQRTTRSQSNKRKLELELNSLSTPVVRKHSRQSQEQGRRRVGRLQKHTQCQTHLSTSDAKVSNVKPSKSVGAQILSATTMKNITIQQLGEERPKKTPVRRCRVKEKEEKSGRRSQCRGATSRSRSSEQAVLHKEHGSATITEMASSALEKMRIFLETHRESEENHKSTEERKRMGEGKEALGHSSVAHHQGASRAIHAPPAKETSHDAPGESNTEKRGMREAGEESTLNDSEEQKGAGKVKQRRGGSMARRLKQMRTEEHDTPSQLHVPSNADFVASAREETERVNGDSGLTVSVTESSQSALGSHWGEPASARLSSASARLSAHSLHNYKDLSPSSKGIKHKMTDLMPDSGEKTPTARIEEQRLLSHTCMRHKLLPLHTPTKDLAESTGSLEEEEVDVDVLEVSSSASDPGTMPTAVWRSWPEEEEEDVEVDVLGLESD